MAISATPATRKCARCKTGDVQHAELWGEVFYGMYCAGCADSVVAEEEAERHRRLVESLLAAGGKTRRLDDFTWEHATQPEVGRRWLNAYRGGCKQNLILFGPVGSGKSGLAWLIVRSLIESEVPAAFVNFRNLLADVRLAFNEGTAASLVEKCVKAPVLVLDDLGAERPTAWALDELSTLIDKRYEAVRPTIITSNYDMNALCKRLSVDAKDLTLGKRIVSRLVEGAEQVHINAADRRLAA